MSVPSAERERGGTPGTRLPRRLFALGSALCLAELSSFYWKMPLGPRGVTAADWVDLASTYAVVLLYGWVLLGLPATRTGAGASALPRGATLVLALAAVTWVLGRGVHVSANSLHDWLGRTGGTDAWGLFHFWDETLGHLLADAGTIGFAIGLTWAERASREEPADAGGGRGWTVAGALAYGFIFFAGSVEGRTVPLTLPTCLLYVGWAAGAALARPSPLGARSVRLFFSAAFATALALLAIWGVWHGGFPEFSATGLGP